MPRKTSESAVSSVRFGDLETDGFSYTFEKDNFGIWQAKAVEVESALRHVVSIPSAVSVNWFLNWAEVMGLDPADYIAQVYEQNDGKALEPEVLKES